jgi:hypothetical protein
MGADALTGFGEMQCTFSPAYVYLVVSRGGGLAAGPAARDQGATAR